MRLSKNTLKYEQGNVSGFIWLRPSSYFNCDLFILVPNFPPTVQGMCCHTLKFIQAGQGFIPDHSTHISSSLLLRFFWGEGDNLSAFSFLKMYFQESFSNLFYKKGLWSTTTNTSAILTWWRTQFHVQAYGHGSGSQAGLPMESSRRIWKHGSYVLSSGTSSRRDLGPGGLKVFLSDLLQRQVKNQDIGL